MVRFGFLEMCTNLPLLWGSCSNFRRYITEIRCSEGRHAWIGCWTIVDLYYSTHLSISFRVKAKILCFLQVCLYIFVYPHFGISQDPLQLEWKRLRRLFFTVIVVIGLFGVPGVTATVICKLIQPDPPHHLLLLK